MDNKYSRRKFLQTSGVIASGMAMGLPSLAHPKINSANDEISVGVIGTGGRGNWLIKNIQDISGMKVNACCDVLPFRLEEGLSLAEKKAQGYEDYRKLLENKNLDAVIIATPLSMHTHMAKDALASGKHIYLEKTMTYSIDEAIELSELVKKSNLKLQVGYQHRYNPLYHKIHKIIADGNLGDVGHVVATWNRNGDWRRPVPDPSLERMINWRMYLEYSGGLMAELSSHQIDIVNYMLGKKPSKVTGFGGINYWKDGRETFDNVYTNFEYEDGMKAQYNCLTTNSHEGFAIKFYGTNATLVIRSEQGHKAYIYVEPKMIAELEKETDAVTGSTMKTWEKGEPIQITVADQSTDDAGPTGNALAHFAECIRGKAAVIANVDYGREAAIAVHMANNAMRNGTIEHWKSEYNV